MSTNSHSYQDGAQAREPNISPAEGSVNPATGPGIRTAPGGLVPAQIARILSIAETWSPGLGLRVSVADGNALISATAAVLGHPVGRHCSYTPPASAVTDIKILEWYIRISNLTIFPLASGFERTYIELVVSTQCNLTHWKLYQNYSRPNHRGQFSDVNLHKRDTA